MVTAWTGLSDCKEVIESLIHHPSNLWRRILCLKTYHSGLTTITFPAMTPISHSLHLVTSWLFHGLPLLRPRTQAKYKLATVYHLPYLVILAFGLFFILFSMLTHVDFCFHPLLDIRSFYSILQAIFYTRYRINISPLGCLLCKI